MRAHTDMVIVIVVPIDNSDMIVTSSRNKSIILWHLTMDEKTFDVARRRLTGHSHFVQDDNELRLWDLTAGTSTRRFIGHTKYVLSVAFSIDNRQIFSASRDRTIKLWNTLGECKYTIHEDDVHTDWVSYVRFSPNTLQPTIVSASCDKTVKVWNLTNCKIRTLPMSPLIFLNPFPPTLQLCHNNQSILITKPSASKFPLTTLIAAAAALASPTPWKMAGEAVVLRGTMRAHTDMVTAIAVPIDNSDMIVTSSRDKSIILWHLTKDEKTFGVPRRRLTGHSHFVQDVVLSSDSQFALSGSWDGELRLWDLTAGTSTRRFVGHTKDVLSVAFSIDNRQIVSASRDRTIKLWNTLGECKYTIQEGDGHSDWVSYVRFSPNTLQPTIVSASWDKTVKVWNLTNCKLRNTLAGHSGYVNTVAVSPDGSLCASGGKDGVILLWDLAEGKKLYSLDSGSIIHSLCFSPNRYWLCAATEQSIKIWDLESKTIVEDLKVDLKTEAEKSDVSDTGNKKKVIYCTSLNWSADGSTLFSGYTDGVIRVWGIGRY
ncbi:hypothetical protein GQ457_08G035720 [Hibiscus cannabinus]